MESLIDKFFSRTSNLDYVTQNIKKISIDTEVDKLFNAINSYSDESELRYVGGCIRKIINKEKIDDIDLATNLTPVDVSQALKKNNINFYETGIEHGTITAVINNQKFEITSLRKLHKIKICQNDRIWFSDCWILFDQKGQRISKKVYK